MAIKTQGSKIIRNLGGEILIQPPIFSLNSDSGITKDGSNNVSVWKDQNRPLKFRAPSGKEPTENGDGIEFRVNEKYLQSSSGWMPNLDKGFSIRADLDLLGIAKGQIIGRWYAAGVTTRTWTFFYSNPSFKLILSEDDVNSGYTFPDYNTGVIVGRRIVNVVCQQNETDIYGGVYFNDDISTINVTSFPKFPLSTDMSNKIEIGGMTNKVDPMTPDLNLYSLELYDYAKINILP